MRLHGFISIAALLLPALATAQYGSKPDDKGAQLGTNPGTALQAESETETAPGDSLRARDDIKRERIRQEPDTLSDAELEQRSHAGREIWESMSVDERASVRAIMREERESSREEMMKRWEQMSPEERDDIRARAQAQMRAGGAVDEK